MNTATIAVRTDPEVKEQAQQIFKHLGLDMSTAINMFLHQTINMHGLPFQPSENPFERRVLDAASEPSIPVGSIEDFEAMIRNA
jgi:DNA-damage-inducible protein J